MCDAALFAEDLGHEYMLRPLVERCFRERNITVTVRVYNARGGRGKVITELGQFIRDIRVGQIKVPDVVVTALDSNCTTYRNRRREVERVVGDLSIKTVYAIPDPHIERWMMLDSEAFKKVLGKGCRPPRGKCDRDRFKKELARAITEADKKPLIGGFEYAEDLVYHMDFARMGKEDRSFKCFLDELDSKIRQMNEGSGS